MEEGHRGGRNLPGKEQAAVCSRHDLLAENGVSREEGDAGRPWLAPRMRGGEGGCRVRGPADRAPAARQRRGCARLRSLAPAARASGEGEGELEEGGGRICVEEGGCGWWWWRIYAEAEEEEGEHPSVAVEESERRGSDGGGVGEEESVGGERGGGCRGGRGGRAVIPDKHAVEIS
jgi:hypothetical protein